MKITEKEYNESAEMMTDFYYWPLRVKAKGVEYLPMTEGMAKDYTTGDTEAKASASRRYARYLYNAEFCGFTKNQVDDCNDLMHKEPSTYVFPDQFEYLRDNAGAYEESIRQVHQVINFYQLLYSRGGYLLDIDSEDSTDPQFYISIIHPSKIVNFAYKKDTRKRILEYVVIDETEEAIQENVTSNNDEKVYRVAGLKDGYYFQFITSDERFKDPFDIEDIPVNDEFYIVYKGQRYEELPFMFINDKDLKADYRMPFFLDLAMIDLLYYAFSADNGSHLYENSQGVWQLTGFEPEEVKKIRFGAGSGAVSRNKEAVIEHKGVAPDGLEYQRLKLQDIEKKALDKSVVNIQQMANESGTARQIMLDSKTVKLINVVLTGALGLEKLLRHIARWTGTDEEEFQVIPNLDFFAKDLDPTLIREMMAAKDSGVISEKTLHTLFASYNLTENSYEQEVDEIKEDIANTDLDIIKEDNQEIEEEI